MKIGVTGATGHVGVNLVKKLILLGHNVRILNYKNKNEFFNSDIEKVYGNVLDPESLKEFCKGLEVIFHLAAIISIGSENRSKVFSTNVEGTKNLVNIAKQLGVKKLIHFSSIHALVHEPLNLPMDESREVAIDSIIPYERTKAIADKWVLGQQSNDFDVIIINPTSIIGPEDYGPSLMGEFIIMAYNGKLPGVVPGGYDWVDVRDIVDASISAIKNGVGGNRYILSGSWLTIKDFADLLIKVSDKHKTITVLPLWLAKIGIPFLYAYAKITNTKPLYTNESLSILQSGNRLISSEKAKEELGFNPRSLHETLTDTYHWFKENSYF